MLNLEKLEKEINDLLNSETNNSLAEWLNKKRINNQTDSQESQ